MTNIQVLGISLAALCLVVGWSLIHVARLEARLVTTEATAEALRNLLQSQASDLRTLYAFAARDQERLDAQDTQLRTAARLFTQQADRISALEEHVPGRKVVRGPWRSA